MAKTVGVILLIAYGIGALAFGGVYLYDQWGAGYGTSTVLMQSARHALLWPFELAVDAL